MSHIRGFGAGLASFIIIFPVHPVNYVPEKLIQHGGHRVKQDFTEFLKLTSLSNPLLKPCGAVCERLRCVKSFKIQRGEIVEVLK